MMEKFDITIVGGGTAGSSCAYIAAKLGLKTLLIEKNSYLGGTITSALVIPAMKTSDNAINTEFFDTLYNKLEIMGGAITYEDGNRGWFNPELTKIALDSMMMEAGVNVLLESCVKDIEEKLSSYIVTIERDNHDCLNNTLLLPIETKYLVDATGDAKICEKLNCEKLNKKNENQPVNLRFIMSGIDVKTFSDWIMEFDKDRNVTTSCCVDGNTYLSTAYTWDKGAKWALAPLIKEAVGKGVLLEEDTNYFQLFSVAGTRDSIAFNAPRLLNYSSGTEVYMQGRASVLRLSEFCKKYLKGFENSYISSIANSIGVRVSTRIKGKYVYTAEDLRSGKKFENPVVISNYPIDIHSKDKDSSVLEKVYQEYQLPLEALIVRDNLFVIGRCLSADFEAQAALRIIPSCFSMGEGLARFLAAKSHL